MFELWRKRSYFLAERDNYFPKKVRDNYSDFIIFSSTVNSIGGVWCNRFEQAVYFTCKTIIFGYNETKCTALVTCSAIKKKIKCSFSKWRQSVSAVQAKHIRLFPSPCSFILGTFVCFISRHLSWGCGHMHLLYQNNLYW